MNREEEIAELRRFAAEHFKIPEDEVSPEQLESAKMEKHNRHLLMALESDGRAFARLSSARDTEFGFTSEKDGHYHAAMEIVEDMVRLKNVPKSHSEALNEVLDSFANFFRVVNLITSYTVFSVDMIPTAGQRLWNAYENYWEKVMQKHKTMLIKTRECAICKTVIAQMAVVSLTIMELYDIISELPWGESKKITFALNEKLYGKQ